MLIWIIGAFGSGKTLIARELQRWLDHGLVTDPEILGFALYKMLPASAARTFKTYRNGAGVCLTLMQADAAYDGHLIVPMTLVRDDYFDEIVGGLRASGVDLRHYALTATPETLRRRLRGRSAYVIGKVLGRDDTWAIQQIDRCVKALANDRYATHVATDDQTPDEVVESIARDADLELIRPRLSRAQERLRRLEVGIRHIRF